MIYPWQHRIWKNLHNLVQSERQPHALLLSAPPGLGLLELAKEFAQFLLCSDAHGQACNTCYDCRLYLSHNHPDIMLLEAEKDHDLKVGQVRELIGFLSLKNFTKNKKIAIIFPAEQMNLSAANALLKNLEEPPGEVMLILLSHFPIYLPITIRSRCYAMALQADFGPETIAWLTEKIGEEVRASDLLHIARGKPLYALQLYQQDQLKYRQLIIDDLNRLHAKQANPVSKAQDWHDHGIQMIMQILCTLLEDLIYLKLNHPERIANIDLKTELDALVSRIGFISLLRYYDFILLKYKQYHTMSNHNPLNILEEIILNWMQTQIASGA